MDINTNLIARLMLNELPGLVGALQPAGPAAQNVSDAAGRQRNQNLANAMLSAASGLLAPSPNRYPLGPLQRLGVGLGAALQSYDGGAQQGRILDALGIDGGGAPVQARVSAIAPGRRGGVAPHARARAAVAPEGAAVAADAPAAPALAGAAGDGALRRLAGRAGGVPRKAGTRAVKLEPFTGTLARRLEHPAVLPGGWKLYGYEKESGRPVYTGPGLQLRVYG